MTAPEASPAGGAGAVRPPPVRIEPDALARIRRLREPAARRVAVLDDDPTGSQSVHGVSVVTVFDKEEYGAALTPPGATCFVLTNTRSLPAVDAGELSRRVVGALFEVAAELGAALDVVSRSDSTLRGHLIAEVTAIAAAKRLASGAGYDGVLLAPAFFEAGRFTADDVQWVDVLGELTPAAQTEFARDATFGYTASNLREFITDRSDGAIRTDDVLSVSLEDIRLGGPQGVAEVLRRASGGAFVVVNGLCYADYEIVVLAVLELAREGREFLYRTGPSFVRTLAGIDQRDPLTYEQIWPDRRPIGHGLVAVGSHVGLTGQQIAVARGRCDLSEVELDVATLLDPARRSAHLAAIAARVAQLLGSTDVMLVTSRGLVTGVDGEASLQIARSVSAGLAEVVRRALGAGPSWVVAKGGITSHDLAVHALGIRRADVLGQLLPGMISVFRSVAAAPAAMGVPFVVFAGNVGESRTLAEVVEVLQGRRRKCSALRLSDACNGD